MCINIQTLHILNLMTKLSLWTHCLHHQTSQSHFRPSAIRGPISYTVNVSEVISDQKALEGQHGNSVKTESHLSIYSTVHPPANLSIYQSVHPSIFPSLLLLLTLSPLQQAKQNMPVLSHALHLFLENSRGSQA